MTATDGRDQDLRVAVLGGGVVGSAVTRNLVAAGLRTMVWDRSPASTYHPKCP